MLRIIRTVPQDLLWQNRYADEAELAAELSELAARIRRGDPSALADLRYLFLPTGPLCEIAASSGWLETYTTLGNRFDELHGRLRWI